MTFKGKMACYAYYFVSADPLSENVISHYEGRIFASDSRVQTNR